MTKEVLEKLNEQIQIELASSQTYLSMASWSDMAGWKGVATFFYEQSDEEREHALKIIHFINDRGQKAVIPTIAVPTHTFKDMHFLFELFMKSEIEVSAKINTIVDTCLNTKDYITYQFMQWYVTEQLEEEILARDLIDQLQIIGDDKGGLYSFDEKLKKNRTEEKE